MNKFIGVETVLAYLMTKRTKTTISIIDLNKVIVSLKREASKQCSSIAFLSSRSDIESCLNDYRDYYSPLLSTNDDIVSISLAKEKTFDDLERIFIKPLPEEVKLLLKGSGVTK